ncbi:hypothetical protein [Lactobacillus sp. Sy-1]|uniref:hypothetical protein n=1 Tax=Lactobacillus sp. Sy-1 TaxID=2109645 RepID=UPI001C5903FE|nr:hypothetical protein [Lactobacillus sp. Sy-1]MBW1605612.1 hypothetical protein [Lactobacillus sp. Sy-1]
MQRLNPETLTMLFKGAPKIKRAMALLHDQWQNLDDDNPFMPQKMTPEMIGLAKQLLATGLVTAKIDFNDYQSVQAFIMHNNSYIDAGAKAVLLAPFQ